MASPFNLKKEGSKSPAGKSATGKSGGGSSSGKNSPDGIWVKCPDCSEILFRKEVERNQWVCVKCSHHFRISADDYLALMVDEGTFDERFTNLSSLDPLKFKDSKRYPDRLRDAEAGGRKDAVVTGIGRVAGEPACVAVMDFNFMGGSMGSVVGEKLARLTEVAIQEELPLIIVSCSGGARMQEGILSLMQLAKTSVQLARLGERGLPFISVMTHPTTGGVTASFAMLGDVILAEPKALIGFAGPRVIEQTIQQELPKGFQRSEFLLEHGMVDQIVSRKDLKSSLAQFIRFFRDARAARPAL
ncbi:MAG: acetyl-CoA carboxylase carboxyltransferase subunit beta [Candidatus Eisenbacteria bacterium]|nr:acetyl-CoA carboxylase carboxyltransferase subunit beta [Candidatus Eisenbacteria bacterium]MCC7144133.1 acetyl-CoA carboxylase carboxyltransferase subunit beta [Candidatus Eisenbacteria bacterium]